MHTVPQSRPAKAHDTLHKLFLLGCYAVFTQISLTAVELYFFQLVAALGLEAPIMMPNSLTMLFFCSTPFPDS